MKKPKVLFFAADPNSAPPHGNHRRLLLDEEVRQIRQAVPARYRDDLDLDTHWAARPDDLLQALDETHPRVVHFSGHCGDDGLILVGSDGSRGHCVGASALAQLFEAYRGDIRVVVLNACLSLPQAEAIAAVVGCAIGTRSAISDAAAISFSSAFYRAIASRNSVKAAFDRARAALALKHFNERDCVQLVVGPSVDPTRLFVVAPDEVPEGKLDEQGGKRGWVRVTAGVLTLGVVAALSLPHGGRREPVAGCAWAGSPRPLLATSGSSPALSTTGGGSSAALSEFDRAKLDYEAGRYAAAFSRFRRFAQSGNPEAMGYLGTMFLRGQGSTVSPDSGIHWLREGAYKRDPQAMTELASAYQYGHGVGRNLGRAREWYHKAADEKHWVEAMRQLADLYRDEQNYGAALLWYQNAVLAGSREARVDAGQLYEHGQGIARDLEEARCLYQTAAEAGSVRGMLNLGRIYEHGIGVPRNDDRAQEWYRRAAAAGAPRRTTASGA